jgi:protein TonB
VVVRKQLAPLVTSTGNQVVSGARETGEGTGAGGQGSGTGSGAGGQGQGAGGASKPVKIAGDINSARDYPRATRDLRIGDYVIVALTVGTDGRVQDCRIHRPSRDAEADRRSSPFMAGSSAGSTEVTRSSFLPRRLGVSGRAQLRVR